eukprot:TRINITY_DN105911_c0_g1_i1.p1 TRINITY_DN105911_c0_g1~~TRINITY_DN105911_c0_g1_i1.p1  ORF type:complete len:766 (-),score=142.05 TRINITY_DN105911_c0_g1_i1:143-2440(-)
MSTTSAAATPWASPASPLSRSVSRRHSSLTAGGIKSSPSTPPPRRGGGRLPEMNSLVDENERLKRELEELRQLTARPGASQVQSTQLMPRGYGMSFSIKSWDAERTGAVAAAGSTDSSQPDAGADKSLSLALPAPAEIVASEPAQQESVAPRQQAPSWLLQRWSSSCKMQELLLEAARAGMKAEHGSREKSYEAFQQAFAVHVGNQERVYLGFSAALPFFFAELGGSPSEICPGQLVAPGLRASETKTSAFACTAELLRRLQGAARFGDKPPVRPEAMEKLEFVRELCAQVGLSLDLVRVHQAYRRHRRRQRSGQPDSEHTIPSIKDAVEASGEGKKERALELLSQARPESDSNPISQAEVQSALSRAGVYLRALQVPLEQLREFANSLAVSAKQAQSSHRAVQKNEPGMAAGSQLEVSSLASDADLAPLLPIADVEVLGNAGEQEGAQAGVCSATDHLQRPEESTALQIQEEARPVAPVAEDLPKLPAGISPQGVVDELLIPSFGQFIDQQLLPLYARDIPFRLLRDTLEHYCGVPVDSDDEDKALKVFDFSTKQKAAPSRSGKLKRRSSEVSGDCVSMPQTPSSQGFSGLRVPPADARRREEPLVQLIQAVGSKQAVRTQMATSVIEKRRTGGPALPDVAAPAPPLVPRIPSAKRPSSKRIEAAQVPFRSSGTSSSHPSRAQKPVATPRVSKALLVSPATEEASAKKRRLLVSPVQWRATPSFDRPPDENAETVTQSASVADFSVFEEDTPWKKKRENAECFG